MMKRILLSMLVWLPMFVTGGCQTESTAPTESAERDYEHQHSHELPAHRPNDIAHSAEEIKNRLEQIQLPDSPPEKRAPQLAELLDIVRWLPELAAESDLSEADWTTIDGESKSVEKKLVARNQQAGQELPLDETLRQAVLSLSETVRKLTADGKWASLEQNPLSKSEDDSEAEVKSQEETDQESAVR